MWPKSRVPSSLAPSLISLADVSSRLALRRTVGVVTPPFGGLLWHELQVRAARADGCELLQRALGHLFTTVDVAIRRRRVLVAQQVARADEVGVVREFGRATMAEVVRADVIRALRLETCDARGLAQLVRDVR